MKIRLFAKPFGPDRPRFASEADFGAQQAIWHEGQIFDPFGDDMGIAGIPLPPQGDAQKPGQEHGSVGLLIARSSDLKADLKAGGAGLVFKRQDIAS